MSKSTEQAELEDGQGGEPSMHQLHEGCFEAEVRIFRARPWEGDRGKEGLLAKTETQNAGGTESR